MLVAITGATGLIGTTLVESFLRDGHTVHRLTRSPRHPGDFAFDPARWALDADALTNADAVIHLAGEPIAQRWTSAVRRRIRDSRVQGTALLAETIAGLAARPRVLVSGSAVGYYGDRGDEILTETSSPGDDFLADVCVAWEAAAEPARAAGVRVVYSRTGVVLDPGGGALHRMLPPFRLGIGGPTGSGRQWMSWIAVEDVVRALRHAIETPSVEGPMNVVGPAPVTNREFTKTLGRVLHRPALIRTPPLALRVMFNDMADATLLASQRAMPEVLRRSGFTFRCNDVESSLRAAVRM